MARALAWLQRTRLGCRYNGHPLKELLAADAVRCPCGQRVVTSSALSNILWREWA